MEFKRLCAKFHVLVDCCVDRISRNMLITFDLIGEHCSEPDPRVLTMSMLGAADDVERERERENENICRMEEITIEHMGKRTDSSLL